ncbi:MAG: hypothetical protein ACI97A_003327 [Planctomycetota bacterium]|jgi:hypothetical protein
MAPEFVSLEQALRELRLKESELKALISNGEIRTYVVGNDVKFKSEEVNRLKQQTGKTMLLGDSALEEPVDDDPESDEIEPFVVDEDESEKHFTFAETAQKLRLSDLELERFVSDGEIEAIGSAPNWKFRRAEVEQLILATGKTVLKSSAPKRTNKPNSAAKRESDDTYFSISVTQQKLRLSNEELRQCVTNGELKAFGVGDQMRFKRDDVERLVMGTGKTVLRTTTPSIAIPDDLIPFEEARQRLHLSADELRRCVKAGQIQSVQHGDETVFNKKAVERLANETGSTMMVGDPGTLKTPESILKTKKDEVVELNKNAPSSADSDTLNFQQARKILRLSDDEFRRFVAAGQIRPVDGGEPQMFRRDIVERLASDTGSTMMVDHMPTKPPVGHSAQNKKQKQPKGRKPKGRPKKTPQLLSFQQASKMLMLKKEELKRLVDEGVVQVHREPDGWKFNPDEIRSLASDTGATMAAPSFAPDDGPDRDRSPADDIAAFEDIQELPKRVRPSDDFDDFVGDFQESETIPIQRQKKSPWIVLSIVILAVMAAIGFLALVQGWI